MFLNARPLWPRRKQHSFVFIFQVLFSCSPGAGWKYIYIYVYAYFINRRVVLANNLYTYIVHVSNVPMVAVRTRRLPTTSNRFSVCRPNERIIDALITRRVLHVHRMYRRGARISFTALRYEYVFKEKKPTAIGIIGSSEWLRNSRVSRAISTSRSKNDFQQSRVNSLLRDWRTW